MSIIATLIVCLFFFSCLSLLLSFALSLSLSLSGFSFAVKSLVGQVVAYQPLEKPDEFDDKRRQYSVLLDVSHMEWNMEEEREDTPVVVVTGQVIFCSLPSFLSHSTSFLFRIRTVQTTCRECVMGSGEGTESSRYCFGQDWSTGRVWKG